MQDKATLELPVVLYQQLSSLAEAEQVPLPVLIERLAATQRRPLPEATLGAPQGTLLGEAVAHEEIHVWDRPHDDSFSMYMGDYAD